MALAPSVAHAQLGLRGSRGGDDQYKRRAERFRIHRSIGAQHRSRIRSRSLVLGRGASLPGAMHDNPLILNREYGLLRGTRGPADRAGRSLRSLRLLNVNSAIVRAVIDIPRASDFRTAPKLDWTTEEVLTALRRDRTTTSLALAEPARGIGIAARYRRKLQARADASFKGGAANFRGAMKADISIKRSSLLSEARHSFEVVVQIEPEKPRGYLAQSLVAYQNGDYNSAVVNIEFGLKRGLTLEAIRVDRESFFEDASDWQRTLDRINRSARSSQDANVHLMLAYLSFLNNDNHAAYSAAEAAEGLLKAALEEFAEKQEDPSAVTETSIEHAKRFRRLLGEAIDAPTKTGPA